MQCHANIVDFHLGDASLCRLRGDAGEWLRRLLISPFLAPAPLFCLLGPSSSEEEDEPVSISKKKKL